MFGDPISHTLVQLSYVLVATVVRQRVMRLCSGRGPRPHVALTFMPTCSFVLLELLVHAPDSSHNLIPLRLRDEVCCHRRSSTLFHGSGAVRLHSTASKVAIFYTGEFTCAVPIRGEQDGQYNLAAEISTGLTKSADAPVHSDKLKGNGVLLV